MSMLQMFGGVAVAGAVAAGSTAFTAAGVTDTISAASSVVGGKVTHTITGARLTAAAFTIDPADAANITGVDLTLDGGAAVVLSTSATVSANLNGGTGDASVAMDCTNGGAAVWNCVPHTGTNYINPTTLAVSVVVP